MFAQALQLRSKILRSQVSLFFTGADRLHLLKMVRVPKGKLVAGSAKIAWRMSCFFTIQGPLWQRQIHNGLKNLL